MTSTQVNRLKAACARAVSVALTRTRQPERSAVAPLAEKLSDRRSVEKEVERVDLGAVAEEITRILRTGGELSKRQLRLAPWCLWGTVPALANDDELLSALLLQIDAAHSARLFRTLAAAYATSFSMDMASRESIASALSAMAGRFQGPWADLQAGFDIFDRDSPTRKLAERVIERQVSPGSCLREQGLGYDAAGSGLARAVLGDALVELGKRDVRDPLDHLAFVRQIALGETGQPLFDGLGHSLLSALLAPLEGRAGQRRGSGSLPGYDPADIRRSPAPSGKVGEPAPQGVAYWLAWPTVATPVSRHRGPDGCGKHVPVPARLLGECVRSPQERRPPRRGLGSVWSARRTVGQEPFRTEREIRQVVHERQAGGRRARGADLQGGRLRDCRLEP